MPDDLCFVCRISDRFALPVFSEVVQAQVSRRLVFAAVVDAGEHQDEDRDICINLRSISN